MQKEGGPDPRAVKVYEALGICFGYTLAHFADFYEFRYRRWVGQGLWAAAHVACESDVYACGSCVQHAANHGPRDKWSGPMLRFPVFNSRSCLPDPSGPQLPSMARICLGVGEGGSILIAKAQQVLDEEFPGACTHCRGSPRWLSCSERDRVGGSESG